MKKIITLTVALFTLSLGSLSAYEYDYYQQECCDSCSDSDFSAYIDYLYWHVCETDLSFSRSTSSESITEYMNPNYDSGWRIGGSYSCDALDLGIRYTDFNSTTTRKLSSPPFPQEATQVFKFDWSNVDIELGYTIPFGCNKFQFRPYAGAKLLWVKESYNDEQDTEFDKHNFNGYGMYVGAEGHYRLWQTNVCCNELETSLIVRGSYGILEGTSKMRDPTNTTVRRGECHFVTTIEMFAGINVRYKASECIAPHFLIGYEVYSLPGWRELDSSNDINSLGLGGLVMRLQVDF